MSEADDKNPQRPGPGHDPAVEPFLDHLARLIARAHVRDSAAGGDDEDRQNRTLRSTAPAMQKADNPPPGSEGLQGRWPSEGQATADSPRLETVEADVDPERVK